MATKSGSISQGTALEQNKLVVDVDPVASTGATHDGAGINRETFNAGLFAVAAGAATGSPTGQTVDAKLQDSADDVTYADVVVPLGLIVAITQITADSKVAELGGNLSTVRKFIRTRVVTTLTGGSSPTIPVSVTGALTGSDLIPA